jgi:hypothetical protein
VVRLLPRLREHRLKLVVSLLALLMLGSGLKVGATWSAFSATTDDTSTVAGGTVALSDNDAGSAMFSVSGMQPGDTSSRCVQVTSTGTLPSLVKLYGSVTGTGLGTYLTLTLTRGTVSSGSFSSCTGFSADSADLIGSGAGVLYTGTLAAFPTTYAGGVTDYTRPSVPEAWTANEVHAYRLTVTLQNNAAAAGKTAGATFTWEARNTTLYSQVVVSDNPSSYWKLDEAAGTSAADSAGAVTGTYVNGVAINQTSGVKDANTAVNFDGVDDRVNFGDNYNFAGTSSFSAEVWIRPTAATASYKRVLSKKFTGGSLGGWELYMASTAEPVPNIITFGREDTTATSRADTVTALQPGTWYHILATYDGNNMRMYLNGVLTETRASTRVIPSTAGQNLQLGTSSNNANRIDASIDEVAIYPVALSAQQAAEHYAAGLK